MQLRFAPRPVLGERGCGGGLAVHKSGRIRTTLTVEQDRTSLQALAPNAEER